MPIPSGKSTVSSKLSPSCRVRPFLVRFTRSKKMARLARRWRGSCRGCFSGKNHGKMRENHGKHEKKHQMLEDFSHVALGKIGKIIEFDRIWTF
jgi:hypothetical protein